MTSRERMIAAIEGRPVECIPVAPYFWGAEYAWKLTGRPLWEVMHGAGDVGTQLLQALDDRHGCDWLIPLHASSGRLVAKTHVGEDAAHVYFEDDSTGEKWVFHKEGHWFVRESELGKARVDHAGAEAQPPRNKAEADSWLRERDPNIDREPAPRVPNRALRERFPDRFLVGTTLPPFADLAYSLGFEPTMTLLADDPALCAYMMERRLAHIGHRCRALAADGFDAGLMVDSFASADIMSPRTYADWVAPFHALISDELHRAGLKSVLYNTGNILPLLDVTAGMGFDVVNVEERIKGVEIDIAEVRRRLGPEICLFGNFDAYLLERGSRDAIRAEVRRQVEAAGPRFFAMGTGSPVCDATDPDVLDFWIDEVRSFAADS